MRYTGPLAVAIIAVLIVLSGCTAPLSGADDGLEDSRELGHVQGYTPTDTIEIDDPNALTREELEAVTYRAMARVEVIRGLQFTDDVEVEVKTREEIRERFDRGDEPADAFTNELWRGTFVVDGETDVNEAFSRLYGEAVQGYYHSNTIVLVADDPDAIRVHRTTLVHELVHALQDQQFGLQREGTTLDERRAENGLIEGEANYLPTLYDQWCETEWQCLPDLEPIERPDDQAERVEAPPFNVGLFLSIYAPYSEGPPFVQHLHETGGWEAVDDAFENRPVSTSQIIHPERYPDERPVDVDVDDRSSDEWLPITDDEGEVRTETIGEATLFASLWANGAIDRPIDEGATALSPYNYSHPATAGWAGDTFVAYENADGQTGHTWVLEWRSDEAAERFADAYRTVLESQGAEPLDGANETYRIDDDESFAGAYRISVDGDRVEIVGAPTVDALEEIRPSSATVPSIPNVLSVDVPLEVSADNAASTTADPAGV